jgi:hypothetical protein
MCEAECDASVSPCYKLTPYTEGFGDETYWNGKAMFVVKINCLLRKQWNQNTPYPNIYKRNEYENVKMSFKYLAIYDDQIK